MESRWMRHRLTVAFLALLATVCLAAGCSSQGEPVQQIITMGDYYFDPVEVKARAGQTIRLTLKNEGRMEHTWTVDGIQVSDLAVHRGDGPEGQVKSGGEKEGPPNGGEARNRSRGLQVAVEPGRQAVVEFKVDEARPYTFYCSDSDHRDAGMEGVLLVTRR